MYVPSTPTVDSIINNTQIKLPRFQRKVTWDNKRRFELCVSLFKGYPLGTIVLKEDVVGKDKKVVKWLLDGRQRRDTFVDMQNPVTIYTWAIEYLDIKKVDEESDIRRKYMKKIFDYLQNDVEDNSDEPEEETIEGEVDVESTNAVESTVFVPKVALDEGTQQLLELICMIHNKSNNKDNFTDPFSFNIDYKPSYYHQDKKTIDSNSLVKWIKSKFSFEEDINSLTVDDIFNKFDNPPEDLRQDIDYNLNRIKKSIKMVKIITEQLSSATVQQIVLDRTCSMADARKIFEIINTKGVALTGAEIMSAKPTWNEPISAVDEDVKKSIEELYRGLKIETDSYVKWDIAASLVYRLTPDSDFILGSIRVPNATAKRITQKMKTKELEKKMTSGFKLMSGRYLGSITKDEMDKMPEKIDNWSTNDFEKEIIDVCKSILGDEPFFLLDSYHFSMCDYIGFTTGLNYLLLMIKKWEELDKPAIKTSAKYRTFISNARVLFDRLIYEYVTGVWKGSSDTRMSRNLNDEYVNVFKRVPDNDWDNLIQSVYYKNTINGQRPTKVALKALLIYFTMLRKKDISASLSEPPEVDHIIPQSRFVGDFVDDPFKDSLFNYALLPKKLNNEKSGNKPNSLGDIRKKKICELEDISVEEFDDIDSVASKDKLVKIREKIVSEIMTYRKEFVNTTGEWEIN